MEGEDTANETASIKLRASRRANHVLSPGQSPRTIVANVAVRILVRTQGRVAETIDAGRARAVAEAHRGPEDESANN